MQFSNQMSFVLIRSACACGDDLKGEAKLEIDTILKKFFLAMSCEFKSQNHVSDRNEFYSSLNSYISTLVLYSYVTLEELLNLCVSVSSFIKEA